MFSPFPLFSRLLCGMESCSGSIDAHREAGVQECCPVSAGLWKVKSWQDLNNNQGASDVGRSVGRILFSLPKAIHYKLISRRQ